MDEAAKLRMLLKYKEIRPPCYYRPSMAVAWPLDVANIVLSSEPQDAEATKSLERTELKTHVSRRQEERVSYDR
jgi:hypothetical protein